MLAVHERSALLARGDLGRCSSMVRVAVAVVQPYVRGFDSGTLAAAASYIYAVPLRTVHTRSAQFAILRLFLEIFAPTQPACLFTAKFNSKLSEADTKAKHRPKPTSTTTCSRPIFTHSVWQRRHHSGQHGGQPRRWSSSTDGTAEASDKPRKAKPDVWPKMSEPMLDGLFFGTTMCIVARDHFSVTQ
eukprot:COSAG06_NODE_16603_length_991_cov_0.941704_2_plen_187_part_01